MQEDFHYYASYCAAILAGFAHEDALTIAYCDQFVDVCSKSFLKKVKGPLSAATTQTQLELVDAKTDLYGLQDITRIWASFHFLPYDLYANLKFRPKKYKNKYRLICNSNGELVVDTVNVAKGLSLQAAGVAMHVLSDTWAHKYFAGTPSLVINNTNYHFFEILNVDEKETSREIKFRHSVSSPDDIENGKYTGSMYQGNENNIMNLGHGRAGHFPDYSFAKYKYLPAWGNYEEIIKDNPDDYHHAFAQMIYALKYIKGDFSLFEKEHYDFEAYKEYEDEVDRIIRKRQLNACSDWKEFGEKLSGEVIPDFDMYKYEQEYTNASKEKKNETFLGKFFVASLAQKSMVTAKIYKSGNRLAGFSVDYNGKKVKGIKDFKAIVKPILGDNKDD